LTYYPHYDNIGKGILSHIVVLSVKGRWPEDTLVYNLAGFCRKLKQLPLQTK